MLEIGNRFPITKCACRFDLLNRVSKLKESLRPLKKVSAKIGPQSVTYDGDVEVDGYRSELIDNSCATELSLVHEDTAYSIELLSIDVGVSEHFHISRLLDPNPRADDISPETVVKRWFD